MVNEGTQLLSNSDVNELLSFGDCISAVEQAFRLHAEGNTLKTGLLHIDAPDGEFHIKAGGLKLDKTYFGLKANGGFFQNRERFGMPNIQGMIVLCDGNNGFPLAIMDSVEITRMRTGAATAVAAKHLAKADSQIVTVCGCGTQGRIQLLALKHILPLTQVFAFGRDEVKTEKFAEQMADELKIEVTPTTAIESAVASSDVVVTCTPSRIPFLMKHFVAPGTFIAAVGADSPDKRELEPILAASGRIVPDILEQCEKVGELHHVIYNQLMTRSDIHGELGEIIAGTKPGRTSEKEIFIFDSTGTALQDVAAAAVVYEKALTKENPLFFNLSR